jgi:NADH:ubiquinone oxidoreductase subunit F (NADH-binding)
LGCVGAAWGQGCVLALTAMRARYCYIYIRGEYVNERLALQRALNEAYEKVRPA